MLFRSNRLKMDNAILHPHEENLNERPTSLALVHFPIYFVCFEFGVYKLGDFHFTHVILTRTHTHHRKATITFVFPTFIR